jgi:hypothetical protein
MCDFISGGTALRGDCIFLDIKNEVSNMQGPAVNDTNATQGQKNLAPRGFRIVISIVFFFIALFLITLITDTVVTQSSVSSNTAETMALVTRKETTRRKSGLGYSIAYAFQVDGKEYSRRWFFGRFAERTDVSRQEYDRLEEGAEIAVIYSKADPTYNRPRDYRNSRDLTFWQFLGVIAFGVIALNEWRLLFIKKKAKQHV